MGKEAGFSSTKYKLLGITLFKTVNTPEKDKFYVLGVPVFLKSNLSPLWDGYRLAYDSEHSNFGDILNAEVLKYMNADFRHMKYYKSNIVCIGSTLGAFLTKNKSKISKEAEAVDVWGLGFMKASKEKEYFIKDVNIYALRGKLTKDRCEKILGRELGDIALGDPGLMVKKIYPAGDAEKKYDVGIIEHYADKSSPYVMNIQLSKLSYKMIDIQGKVEDVIKDINSCRFILSSALHGLITADSYGIPNKWMRLSDEVVGGDFKFNDYYSVFGIENVKPVDLRQGRITDADIEKFRKEHKVPMKKIDEIIGKLTASFPRKKAFPASLDKIQNLRLFLAIAEIDKNILAPIKDKDKIDYINTIFNYKVKYCNPKKMKCFEDIELEHDKPVTRYRNQKLPLVFPRQMVEYCKIDKKKDRLISFAGFGKDSRRRTLQNWMREIVGKEVVFDENNMKYEDKKVSIEFTSKGRDWPEKGWDEEYYNELQRSQFVLCANGDFVWTYRFFEAVMCGAIPVIEDTCDLYEGFFYYDMKTPLHKLQYDKSKAEKNHKLFVERYCLK